MKTVTGRHPSKPRTPKKQIVADIVRRVVQAAQPDMIILFGSGARGEMGPNSDLDLLVVKSGKYRRDRVVERIYANLHGAGQAVDVIVVTPEEVERYRNTPCLVISPALQEGRIIYGG